VSAELVNLRRARKAKAREAAAEAAAENRAKHGRPASERRLERARELHAEHELDQKKIDR
jgi:hypothetical protein